MSTKWLLTLSVIVWSLIFVVAAEEVHLQSLQLSIQKSNEPETLVTYKFTNSDGSEEVKEIVQEFETALFLVQITYVFDAGSLVKVASSIRRLIYSDDFVPMDAVALEDSVWAVSDGTISLIEKGAEGPLSEDFDPIAEARHLLSLLKGVKIDGE